MTLCTSCGNPVEFIRGRWTHVVFRDDGEIHHVWCHTTKAFPESEDAL